MSSANSYKLQTPPPNKYKWRLALTPVFGVLHPIRPNVWWRFWQRVLLGWKWESIEGPGL